MSTQQFVFLCLPLGLCNAEDQDVFYLGLSENNAPSAQILSINKHYMALPHAASGLCAESPSFSVDCVVFSAFLTKLLRSQSPTSC